MTSPQKLQFAPTIVFSFILCILFKLGQSNYLLHAHDSKEDAFIEFQRKAMASASQYPWNRDAFPPLVKVCD